MEELIDVVDENCKKTGEKIPKSQAHKDGTWHQSAHIWIYNRKGEVLLQKRAKVKAEFPGLWDTSSSGHLTAGDTPIQGAQRELFEELSIRAEASELKKIEVRKIIQRVPEKNFVNNGFAHVYLFEFNGNISKLKLQKEEVDEVKFVSLELFKSEVSDPEKVKKYAPHGKYYLDIIKVISQELSE